MKTATLTMLLLIATPTVAQYNLDRCQAGPNPGMVAVLVGQNEPGPPLVISGVVRDKRGKPVPAAYVRAFHADARGIYTTQNDKRPRICGVARTDAAGRYRFVTIKPGSYPNTRQPAHVHFEIWGAAIKVQHARLEFEGDPFLTQPKSSSRSGIVRPLSRDADGSLRCERDFVVTRNGR